MFIRIIVIIYILLTVAIGIWSKKKANNSRVFDGMGLGMLLCVVAGAGEWMGGTSTTGVSEYGYDYGISGAWYTIANGLGICFLAIFFARLFRSMETPTVSGIIGKYIGEKACMVSSALLIFVMMAVGTSQMVAIGTLGETLFGFNETVAILILGIGILVYTILGGMMAVGYTNFMHLLVMYTGAILAVLLCFINIGDFNTMKESLPDSYFSMTSIGMPKVSSWLIASILGACTAQAGLQPILAAKDEQTAVKSSFVIALLVAPFGILTALMGMFAKMQFPDLANGKLALPSLLMTLPPMAGGLLIASIMAAVLSTASPIFLSCGTLFTRDIYVGIQKKRGRNKSDKEILKVQRTATFIAGGSCIIIALVMGNASAILDIVYFAYSIRGSLFIVLLLGIFWKRISEKGAIISMVMTGAVSLFWIYYKGAHGVYPISDSITETYIAVIVSLTVTVIGSIIFKKINFITNDKKN